MLLYLLVYSVIGLVAIFSAALIHMCVAYKMGIDLEIIVSVLKDVMSKDNHIVLGIILGVLIWPIRLIQFIANQNILFDMYNQFR